MSLDATHRHCTRDKDSTDEQIATADVNKKKSSIFRHSFERLAVGGSADQGRPSKLELRREVSYCCSPTSTSLFDDGPHSFFFFFQNKT